MIEVAGILLYSTDGLLVLQRRDDKAATAPNKLGLFGGHTEPHESPEVTARRELAEETSLDVDALKLEFVTAFRAYDSDKQQHVHCTAFRTIVPTTQFEVYEGVGLEVYNVEEVLKRDDLTLSAKTAIVKAQEKK